MKNGYSRSLLRWVAIMAAVAVLLAVALLAVAIFSWRNAVHSAHDHMRTHALGHAMAYLASLRRVDRCDHDAMQDHATSFAFDSALGEPLPIIRILTGRGEILVSSEPSEQGDGGGVSAAATSIPIMRHIQNHGDRAGSVGQGPLFIPREEGGELVAMEVLLQMRGGRGRAHGAAGRPPRVRREVGGGRVIGEGATGRKEHRSHWGKMAGDPGCLGERRDAAWQPGEYGARAGGQRVSRYVMVTLPVTGRLAGVSTARMQLGLSVAVSALLLLLAGLAYRESRRAAALGVQMERRRHLANLGEMAAVLAHEIRNPVGVVRGYAQLLLERIDSHDGEAVRGSAENVLLESERLGRLVDQLLAYARPQPPVMEPLDLNRVVEDAILIHGRGAMERGVDIVRQPLPDQNHSGSSTPPLVVIGDRDMLVRLLGNLISNAVEASPDGASVLIQVAPHGVRQVAVRVGDQGPGITADLEEKVFEPFFTTSSGGTGLGLAVARQLAEKHSGDLTLEAAHGDDEYRGAVFCLLLPRVEKKS